MMVAGKNSVQRALPRYMCILHCFIRGPATHINMRSSTQVFGKINDRIDVMLPGAPSDKFIFETIPFKVILGYQAELRPGDDGEGGGMNADGTYTARDKVHAHSLMRDGRQGGRFIDPTKVLASVEWFKANDAPNYNCGSMPSICHKAEASISSDDQARSRNHYPLSTFEGVPGVHHLVKGLTDSMDLCNDMPCASFVLQGGGGISKTEFMKAVVGRVFGEVIFVTNTAVA